MLWDVGGVFLPSPFSRIRGAGSEHGIDGETLLELTFGPYHEDTDHPWHQLERGECTLDECNALLLAAAKARGYDIDPLAVLMSMGTGGLSLVRDDVLEVAQRIRQSDVRTAIITNNAVEFREGWKSLFDVDAVVELVIDSSEVGVRKPDPAIFHLTLERLGGIAPEAAVFLDDAPGNIVAAEAIGIHAILVDDDPAAALQELEEALAA